MSDEDRSALDVLVKAAQVLAVGTGESQLHAAAEHVAVALGADSVSLLALLSDPEFVYLVADSDELDTGRMRYALAQYPHIRRALEAGEVTITVGGDAGTGGGDAGSGGGDAATGGGAGAGGGDAGSHEVSAVYPGASADPAGPKSN